MSSTWLILCLCALSLARAQNGYGRDNPLNPLSYNPFGQLIADEGEINGDEIPGEAGVDYPVFNTPPITRFRCDNQNFPGYYADPESRCQAFYICQRGGRGNSFLCPNGTIFNQNLLVCDWWYNFDCNTAVSFYGINEEIVRAMEEADARIQERRSGYDYNAQDNSGSYENANDFVQVSDNGAFGDNERDYKIQSNRANLNGYTDDDYLNGYKRYQNTGINGVQTPSSRYLPPRPSNAYSAQANLNPVYRVPNIRLDQSLVKSRNFLPSQNVNSRQYDGKISRRYGAPTDGLIARRNNVNQIPSTVYSLPKIRNNKPSVRNNFNDNRQIVYSNSGNGYPNIRSNVYKENRIYSSGYPRNNVNSVNTAVNTYLPPVYSGNTNFQSYKNDFDNGPSFQRTAFSIPSSYDIIPSNIGRTYLPPSN